MSTVVVVLSWPSLAALSAGVGSWVVLVAVVPLVMIASLATSAFAVAWVLLVFYSPGAFRPRGTVSAVASLDYSEPLFGSQSTLLQYLAPVTVTDNLSLHDALPISEGPLLVTTI